MGFSYPQISRARPTTVNGMLMLDSLFALILAPFICLQFSLNSVTSIVDGLKKLYIQKLKPLEVAYHFNDFVSPLLVGGAIHFSYASFLFVRENIDK